MAKSSSIIIIDFQSKYNLMDIDSVEKKQCPPQITEKPNNNSSNPSNDKTKHGQI